MRTKPQPSYIIRLLRVGAKKAQEGESVKRKAQFDLRVTQRARCAVVADALLFNPSSRQAIPFSQGSHKQISWVKGFENSVKAT